MQVRKREYRSGRVGWQVDISGVTEDGKPFRRRQLQAPESVTSKSGAQRWGEEQRRRLERGEEPATARAARRVAREREEAEQAHAKAHGILAATVTEAARWYLAEGEAARLAPTTLDLRERICRDHICAVEVDGQPLRDRRVCDLTEADAMAVARHAAPLSAGFAHLIMRNFRGLINAARTRGVACDLVVKLPKAPTEEEPRAYDPGSYERLVEAAATFSPAHLVVVLLSGEAALRRGEILGLTVEDATLALATGAMRVERQVVRVKKQDLVRPPKHGRKRSVPLSPRCLAALAALVADQAPDSRLILSSDGSAPATAETLRWYLSVAQRAAGLPVVGPHAARHTALSHMLASGSDLKVVQTIAGHKHVTTTARYLHAMPDAVARAGAQVESWRRSAAVTSTQLAPKPRSRARLKPNDGA